MALSFFCILSNPVLADELTEHPDYIEAQLRIAEANADRAEAAAADRADRAAARADAAADRAGDK